MFLLSSLHQRTNAFLLVLLIVGSSFALAQEKPSTRSEPILSGAIADEIAEAISALESPKFTVREQASRELWQIGLPAQASLEQVSETGSPDARERASKLLSDFRIGILPSTSRQNREQINRFRYGSPQVRQETFTDLLGEIPTKWIEGLVASEPDPRLRFSLLLAMWQDGETIKNYDSPNAIVELVERCGVAMDAQWRRSTTTTTLLFSPMTMQQIVAAGKLASVEQYVSKQAPAERTLILGLFGSNSSLLRDLILGGNREFLWTMLDHAVDEPQAAALSLQIFNNPVVAQALVIADGFLDTLDELEKRFDRQTTQQVLLAALRQPSSVGLILQQMQYEGLMQLAERVDVPRFRMECLGHAMANSKVIAHLQSEDQLDELLRIADDELRTIYWKTITNAGVLSSLAEQDATEMIAKLWNRFVPLDDPEMQRIAITQIVGTPLFVLILKDRDSAKAILRSIAGLPVEGLSSMLAAMTQNPEAMSFFADKLLLGEILAAADKLDEFDAQRGRMNTGKWDVVVNQLVTIVRDTYEDLDAKIESWMKSAENLDPSDRSTALASLTVVPMSEPLAKRLITKLVEHTPDEMRGPTLAMLSRSPQRSILELLHSAAYCDWVVAAMETLDTAEWHRVGTTIVSCLSISGFRNAHPTLDHRLPVGHQTGFTRPRDSNA